MLLTATCPTNVDNQWVAPELAEEQTLENLQRFSDRLSAAWQRVCHLYPPGPIATVDCESGYEWVNASIGLLSGKLKVTYKAEELDTEGEDTLDDDVRGWNDKDVQRVAGELIGVHPDEYYRIQITEDMK